MTNSTPINRTQAKRWAKLLHDWGYYGIQIAESFPENEVRLSALNRCGQRRTIATHADFIELRELEASRT